MPATEHGRGSRLLRPAACIPQLDAVADDAKRMHGAPGYQGIDQDIGGRLVVAECRHRRPWCCPSDDFQSLNLLGRIFPLFC